jgi:hypothetical protein
MLARRLDLKLAVGLLFGGLAAAQTPQDAKLFTLDQIIHMGTTGYECGAIHYRVEEVQSDPDKLASVFLISQRIGCTELEGLIGMDPTFADGSAPTPSPDPEPPAVEVMPVQPLGWWHDKPETKKANGKSMLVVYDDAKKQYCVVLDPDGVVHVSKGCVVSGRVIKGVKVSQSEPAK